MRGVSLLLLSLLWIPACDPEPRPVRMLILGLDGADWDVIDPLVESGHLPHIGALVADGMRADLDCVPAWPSFACYCPPVWTSIMTGQPAAVHQMRLYEDRADERESPALWNLNGSRGGVNTLVSIRNSWPFEEDVNWGLSEPGLDVAAEEIFAPWGGGQLDHPALALPKTLYRPSALLRILHLLPAKAERRPAFRMMARDRVAMDAMFRLAPLTRFTSLLLQTSELVIVTLHSPDKSEHIDWGAIQAVPEGPIDQDVLRAQAGLWQGPVFGPAPYSWGTVASQYLEADRWLGELLERIDYDYVVLVSDHGMGRNPDPGLPGHHHPGVPEAHRGILSITGPGVRAGAEVEATVLDVAPTVAYLMHLPVAQDLPGRVLVEALSEGRLARDPIEAVPSW